MPKLKSLFLRTSKDELDVISFLKKAFYKFFIK